MKEQSNLAEMDIKQAVLPPNGNGLATAPFTPSWGFLGVLGWKHIETGVEAWVCDGRILTATTIARDLRHIIGHKQFVRRVILRPEPLRVQASAKTSDLLNLSLDVSVAYRVIDPAYAAAASAPLVELREAARGVIMEFIPQHTLYELIKDDSGETRRALQSRLMDSPVFSGHFAVEEVLSVGPTGDSRLIDVDVQIRMAEASAGLIDQQGQNQRIAASHELAIQQDKLEQEDEFKHRDHKRRMEDEWLKEQGAIARTALETVGKLGSSGAFTAEQVTQFLSGTNRLVGGTDVPPGGPVPGSPEVRPPEELPAPSGRTATHEEEALASIAQEYGILDYHVFQAGGRVSGASVKLRRREINFTTDSSYPHTPPIATVSERGGSQYTASLHWFKDRSTLADAVLAILAKLPTEPVGGGGEQ